MEINERHILLLGLAMIFFVVTTFGFFAFFRLVARDAVTKEIPNPIIALEFVKTTADIEKITGKKTEAHNGLKTFLLLDSFAFVPLYLGFLLLMSFYLSQASFKWAQAAAIIAVALTVLAAVADWTENYYSYDGLDALIAGTEGNVYRVFLAAHVKWISIFFVVAVSAVFFWRGVWAYAAGAIAFFSLVGLIGLLFYSPLVTAAIAFQFSTIFVIGALFLFKAFRHNFLRAGLG
jgi:hypothetical protein